MRQVGTYAAAWVPEVADLPWEEAEALACNWLRDQLAARGGRLLVVAETKANIDSANHGPLAALVRSADQVTRRSRQGAGARRGRVVLALYATPHVMELAVSAAGPDGALCAVEGIRHELLGWAQDLGAADLRTGRPTPDTRSAALKADIDRLAFVGNNGWGDEYGKRDAVQILGEAAGRGELDPAVVLGAMIARGASGYAVERLARLAGTKL